ncbi:phosphatidylglycerol lysyltransferase domain-containing protein [Streptomyces sp. MMBL 11-3]|uniref:phosphatidylglycerol lysyltransferase domain-containing protein n=1 Tax=Streptomyces sp. MMBL 11-3 TaxID=3382639 RepID=UPI0039B45883
MTRSVEPSATTRGKLETVLEVIREHGDNASAFLAANEGNAYFEGGAGGFAAYRPAGRYLVQFGGVFAPPQERRALVREFRAYARAKRRRIVGIQLQRADAELYASEGFTVNQVGASYSVHLPEFTLRGTRFMKLRNKISRAGRSGLVVRELPHQEVRERIGEIDRLWLRSKGRHVKEIEFLVGQVGGPLQHHRRLFVGFLDERPVAYISYSPAHGSRPGWLHDLSRRLPDTIPGAMEAVNAAAVEAFAKEGAPWLHFGFTPFTGLDPARELPGHSPLTARFIRLLAERGGSVYPAATQLAYKEKWGPHLVQPEYLAFEGRARPGAVWQVLRVTKSV